MWCFAYIGGWGCNPFPPPKWSGSQYKCSIATTDVLSHCNALIYIALNKLYVSLICPHFKYIILCNPPQTIHSWLHKLCIALHKLYIVLICHPHPPLPPTHTMQPHYGVLTFLRTSTYSKLYKLSSYSIYALRMCSKDREANYHNLLDHYQS